MTTSPTIEPTKNPTALLHEQVTVLQEIQQSLYAINQNQIKILESLAGLKAYNERLQNEKVGVTVADVNMSFGSMISFMVKWSIAAIPAAITLLVLGALVWIILGGVLSGLF